MSFTTTWVGTGLLLDEMDATDTDQGLGDKAKIKATSKLGKVVAASDKFVDLFRRAAVEKRGEKE